MPLNLLVVDDDPVVRQVTCRMLDEAGYLSLAAASCQEALLLMENPDGRPAYREFDLCVLDVRLPDGSGLDLARSLKQRRPSMPVLFVSGYPESHGEELPDSGWTFLSKPYTATQLVGAVRRLLPEPSEPGKASRL